MVMSLKQRLQDDVKAAMKSGAKQALGALRLVMAEIKQREVDENIVLDDAQIMAVMDRMLKKRRDALSQFQQAQRADLADQERFEIELIQAYLPVPLDAAALDELLRAGMTAAGATGLKDLGKVMAHLKPQLQGRADMSVVSQRLKALLTA